MTFDFNQTIERHDTGSVKWDFVFDDGILVARSRVKDASARGPEALLPLWVADMDFLCPQAVTDAIVERAQHGIFGYSLPLDGFYEAITDWAKENYRWHVERDWIVLSPGVVPAMNFIVETFAQAGEKILIQGPVYYHFMRAPTNHGIEFVSNDLVYDRDQGRYSIDFDDFEKKASDPKTTIAMLCNPHNPTSRVWQRDELERLADICIRHDLLIVSDEIHCDLIFQGHEFIPMASLSPTIADRTITMMAPSKTFNLAGFKTSHTVISNPELRARYSRALQIHGQFGGNCMGIVATEAAYRHGREWLDAALAYIFKNYEFTRDYLADALPAARVIEPQGTYLLWIDCEALGFSPEERKRRIYNEAGVFLDNGSMFGPVGASFERVNLACPREILETALKRMVGALT